MSSWKKNTSALATLLQSRVSPELRSRAASMEYSFSGSNPDSQHGAGLVLLSRPYFARFIELAQKHNEEAADRMLNMAVAMGFGADEDGDLHPFLEGLQALLEAVGLAEMTPESLGFDAAHVDRYVAAAMQLTGSRQFLNTPVPMAEADVRAIFEGVFER